MDRAVHRPARHPRDGRISGDRHRPAPQRGIHGWREINARKPSEPRRILAAVARVCGAASLGRRRKHRRKGTTMNLACKTIESPVGELRLFASDEGLVAILWENDHPRRVRLGEAVVDDRHSVLVETERELGGYFAGKREKFSVPLGM